MIGTYEPPGPSPIQSALLLLILSAAYFHCREDKPAPNFAIKSAPSGTLVVSGGDESQKRPALPGYDMQVGEVVLLPDGGTVEFWDEDRDILLRLEGSSGKLRFARVANWQAEGRPPAGLILYAGRLFVFTKELDPEIVTWGPLIYIQTQSAGYRIYGGTVASLRTENKSGDRLAVDEGSHSVFHAGSSFVENGMAISVPWMSRGKKRRKGLVGGSIEFIKKEEHRRLERFRTRTASILGVRKPGSASSSWDCQTGCPMRVRVSSNVRLRSKPNTNSKIIRYIPDGDVLFLSEYTGREETHSDVKGRWAKVRHGFTEGFVFGGFLEPLSHPKYGYPHSEGKCLIFAEQKFPSSFSEGCLGDYYGACFANECHGGVGLIFFEDKRFKVADNCSYDFSPEGQWRIENGALLVEGYSCTEECDQEKNICKELCRTSNSRKYIQKLRFDYQISFELKDTQNILMKYRPLNSEEALNETWERELTFECMRSFDRDPGSVNPWWP